MNRGELLLREVDKAITRFIFIFIQPCLFNGERKRSHCLFDMAWFFMAKSV